MDDWGVPLFEDKPPYNELIPCLSMSIPRIRRWSTSICGRSFRELVWSWSLLGPVDPACTCDSTSRRGSPGLWRVIARRETHLSILSQFIKHARGKTTKTQYKVTTFSCLGHQRFDQCLVNAPLLCFPSVQRTRLWAPLTCLLGEGPIWGSPRGVLCHKMIHPSMMDPCDRPCARHCCDGQNHDLINWWLASNVFYIFRCSMPFIVLWGWISMVGSLYFLKQPFSPKTRPDVASWLKCPWVPTRCESPYYAMVSRGC